MARLDRGRFLIDRAHNASFGKDGYLLALWVKLNEWANFRPTSFKYGSKEITIQRGELLTAVIELAEELGFTRRVIKARLDYLRASGSIDYVRKNRGILISIKNYHENQSMKHSSTSSETKETSNGEFDRAHDGAHDGAHETDTYELSNTVMKKEKREGDPPPPILNSEEDIGEREAEKKRIAPIDDSRMPPSDDPNTVGARWYSRASKMAPNRRLSLNDICAQTEQLRRMGYDDEKQNCILNELEQTEKSYRTRFVSPDDALKDWFGTALIETAYVDYLKKQKGGPLEVKKKPAKTEADVLDKLRAQSEKYAKLYDIPKRASNDINRN